MPEKNQYQTRQRTELTEYMRRRGGEWISSRVIINDPSIGLGEATVYRILARLAEDGILEKKPSESGHGSLYRYSATSECRGHIHLRCLKCDSTICLHSDELLSAEQQIGSSLGFSVDESKSTLFGICRQCKNNGGTI